jgi:adenine-specific DNA-methyltransferase
MDDKQERYQMTWPDKKKSILLANSRINATLRPVKEKSVDFDNTQNLYIEGDNLDVLKLLRETYLGKIKMIYIDPPYNTGNDFVYEDDFSQSSEEYLARSGQFDDQGNRLFQNNDSNGRFHTDWLNMMYPRLKIAKDLLSDDGVFLISMADNEVSNLLKICEELFGKKNIEIFVWKKKGGAGNTEKVLGVLTEYIVCCFKNKKPFDLNYQYFEREYKLKDDNGKYNLEGIEKTNLGTYERKTMLFPIVDPETGKKFYPGKDMRWTLGEDTIKELIEKKLIFFDYKSDKVKRIKRPNDYELSQNVYYNLLLDEGSLSTAKNEIGLLFGNKEVFDTPKPTNLIKTLINICSKEDSIILDFFSGSATTAHSVLLKNIEDEGMRRFILVQLNEHFKEDSEAFKIGYKDICELAEERIRRAGIKIKNETGDLGQNLDIGFRVLKLDSSNMNEVYYNPNRLNQNMLDQLVGNIKEDRTPLDLLFQVMLELGIELSAKIEDKELLGKKYFIVNENDLVACFDDGINDELVKELAKIHSIYAVFKDSAFINDSANINCEQIFKSISPSTTIKVV